MAFFGIQRPDGERVVLVEGRNEWALRELLRVGRKGCTPIDNPGPRWSAYVYNLRQMGFDIETIHEAHKGKYPGTHARYILHSVVMEVDSLHDI